MYDDTDLRELIQDQHTEDLKAQGNNNAWLVQIDKSIKDYQGQLTTVWIVTMILLFLMMLFLRGCI